MQSKLESRSVDEKTHKLMLCTVGLACAGASVAGRDTPEAPRGYLIVSRWGTVQHQLGCVCRPCKSRRRAGTKEPNATVRTSKASQRKDGARVGSEPTGMLSAIILLIPKGAYFLGDHQGGVYTYKVTKVDRLLWMSMQRLKLNT